MTDFSGMRLGRRPHRADALQRAPQLARHAMASAPPPPRLIRTHYDFVPSLDRNDAIGDCTAVGVANCARAAAALSGYRIDIATTDVVRFYSLSCGYDPADPATDRGGVELDVLAFQLRAGFMRENHEPLVADFATADPADRAMLAASMARCGTVYLGVDLAEADQDAGSDVVWDIDTPAAAGDPTPGSWGGHCLFAWDYAGLADTDIVRLGTWGGWQRATWRWLRSRTEEAHVLIWRDLQTAAQRNFAGIDYDALRAEGLAFTA